jgi:hypothetical protein
MKSLITAAALLLLPALVLAQKTSFDYDKTADLSSYKTYALKDGTKVGDPLVDSRITAAIEAELAAKGMTKKEVSPDVVVVYHVAFDKQKDITAYSTGGGYGGYGYRYGGGWPTTTDVRVNEITVGTLVIDVADTAKNAVVWRGMGVREVDTQAKAEKRDKNISGAVKKILANFPPKKKA